MKRSSLVHTGFSFLAAALLCLSTLGFSSADARAVEIREVTSPGGITAWLVEDYSVPIISMAVSFAGGSTQDPQGREGMAELISALFDEGAGPYDSKQFQARIEKLGIDLSYSDARDEFTGSLRTLRDDRAQAFEMMRLSLSELHFEERSVERMREAVLANIERKRNSPSSKSSDALREAMFGTHPYGRESQGKSETVAAISREEMIAHFNRLFARDNLKVGIVGAISPDEARTMLDQVFGKLPDKAELTPVDDMVPEFGKSIRIDEDMPQSTITLIYPGVKRDAPDFFAAYLANHILGGGTFSSRLYDTVREKRGLAYSVNSTLATYRHASFVAISAATRADREEETLSIMRSETERLAKEGPTQAELDAAKKYVIGSYAINNLDSSTRIAGVLISLQTENLGIDYIDTRAAKIAAVTLDDVRKAARKLFSATPTQVVVGPPRT
ncbi:MAG: pitrilysin family protein [Rhizobiaceae bacterium]